MQTNLLIQALYGRESFTITEKENSRDGSLYLQININVKQIPQTSGYISLWLKYFLAVMCLSDKILLKSNRDAEQLLKRQLGLPLEQLKNNCRTYLKIQNSSDRDGVSMNLRKFTNSRNYSPEGCIILDRFKKYTNKENVTLHPYLEYCLNKLDKGDLTLFGQNSIRPPPMRNARLRSGSGERANKLSDVNESTTSSATGRTTSSATGSSITPPPLRIVSVSDALINSSDSANRSRIQTNNSNTNGSTTAKKSIITGVTVESETPDRSPARSPVRSPTGARCIINPTKRDALRRLGIITIGPLFRTPGAVEFINSLDIK